MNVIGIDIGGANIKISDGELTLSRSFPLWRDPGGLVDAIDSLLARFSPGAPLAVTMTGELADCFQTKEEGVQSILNAVESVGGDRMIQVWQTGGEFVSLEEARELAMLVAAANWHALATWAGRMCPHGPSLVIDIGSTTTDVIPIEDGIPSPRGRTDLERLATSELLYLGVRRTPACAIAGSIPVQGRWTGVARELFATTQDVHLLLELMPDEPENCETANGRPATRQCAGDRLARLVCADRTELDEEELTEIARFLFESELSLVIACLQSVEQSGVGAFSDILLSGEGEFLARLAVDQLWPERNVLSLNQMLGPQHSQAGCAFALSRLGSERF